MCTKFDQNLPGQFYIFAAVGFAIVLELCKLWCELEIDAGSFVVAWSWRGSHIIFALGSNNPSHAAAGFGKSCSAGQMQWKVFFVGRDVVPICKIAWLFAE